MIIIAVVSGLVTLLFLDLSELDLDSELITSYQLERNLYHDEDILYLDIETDGDLERIEIKEVGEKGPRLVVLKDNHVINQWDFMDPWMPSPGITHADVDGNGLLDLFVFTKRGDSVFVNRIKDFKDKSSLEKVRIFRV